MGFEWVGNVGISLLSGCIMLQRLGSVLQVVVFPFPIWAHSRNSTDWACGWLRQVKNGRDASTLGPLWSLSDFHWYSSRYPTASAKGVKNGKHVISVLVLLLPGPILVDVHVEKFYLSLSFACVSRLSSLPVLFNIYLKFWWEYRLAWVRHCQYAIDINLGPFKWCHQDSLLVTGTWLRLNPNMTKWLWILEPFVSGDIWF